VGITVPGLRPWGADISYVGVLPEHRGNGYADELLLEASHLLVEGGATEIVAATDVGNAPMATNGVGRSPTHPGCAPSCARRVESGSGNYS
jgi:GNAT superfamily N-acetyltransferase